MEIDKNNKIITKVETPFGLRRNLNFIKVNIFLMIKKMTEYKASLYASFLDQIFFILVQFLFFFVLYSAVGDVINWELVDYILYFILSDLIFVVSGFLIWKGSFSQIIINGDLNLQINKPINILFKFIFSNLSNEGLFYMVSDTLMLIGVYIYFQFSFENLGLFLVLLFLIILAIICINFFIMSLALIKIKLDEIVYTVYNPIGSIVTDYPAPFFKKTFFKNYLFIFPAFFIGSLLIPVLRGYKFMFNPYLQVGIILGLIIFFSIGTWLNWHYGLKKYEAFG